MTQKNESEKTRPEPSDEKLAEKERETKDKKFQRKGVEVKK